MAHKESLEVTITTQKRSLECMNDCLQFANKDCCNLKEICEEYRYNCRLNCDDKVFPGKAARAIGREKCEDVVASYNKGLVSMCLKECVEASGRIDEKVEN